MTFTVSSLVPISVIDKVFEWIHETDSGFRYYNNTKCVMIGLLVWDKSNEAIPDIWTMPDYAEKVNNFYHHPQHFFWMC